MSAKSVLPEGFRSHDVVGDICVVNLRGFSKKELGVVGESVLGFYPSVKTVVNVESDTRGEFRVRSVRVIAGEKRFVTVHRENGFRFALDLSKMFFSSRLQNERLRVLRQVRKKEVVVDLFAGVGPFIIPISKKCREAWAVEKNPWAFKSLVENVALNKAVVNCVKGDASRVKLPFADRFIMNLPGESKRFLPRVFGLANPGAIVHYYSFCHESELFDKPKQEVSEIALKCSRRIKFLDFVKAGNTGPGWWRVCVDFKIY